MIHNPRNIAKRAGDRNAGVSRERSLPSTRSTAVARREVMTLGVLGLTWLLFPCKSVFADDHTIGHQLLRELLETEEDFRTKQLPKIARSRLEDIFKEEVKKPKLLELQGAPQADREQVEKALDLTQNFLGGITEDWTGRILRGENILDALKQSVDKPFRLEQPTFAPPFEPGFEFEIGTPKPSTSQSVSDMLQRLKELENPIDVTKLIDPTKLKVEWEVFELKANSDFDSLSLKGSVKADSFLDPSFNIVSPKWKAEGGFRWEFFHNGAINHLDATLRGEFNKGSTPDVWFGISGHFEF